MRSVKLLRMTLLVFVITGISASAFAGGKRGYGMGGCGLGSSVFGDSKNASSQVGAYTLNQSTTFSSTQGSAITTGTSNCKSDDELAAVEKIQYFVEVNQSILANESARGGGEALVSLSELLGCSDSARLGQIMQKNYGEVFPAQRVTGEDWGNSILRAVRQDPVLLQNCSQLI